MPSTDYTLEFTHASYLYGMLAIGWVVLLAVWSLANLGRRQRFGLVVVRSTVVMLLVAALAGMSLISPSADQFVIFAIDESVSVSDAARSHVAQFIQDAQEHLGPHRVAFVRFADNVGPVSSTYDTSEGASLNRMGTDLASAVRRATASMPTSYALHVVLFSDGRETRGNVLHAALVAEVPISTVPLPGNDAPEVLVAAIQAPAEVRTGEPFFVDVIVNASHDGEGTVDVFEDSHLLVSQPHHVSEGENRFRFRHSLNDRQQARITVRLRAFRDTQLDNNTAAAIVHASGTSGILLIHREPESSNHLRWALEEEGIAVDARPIKGLPEDLAQLDVFDLLILADVPALSLSSQQVQSIRHYVETLGGGLIVIGGEQSFGLGGYYGSALEEVLPVRSDFERDQEKPSLTMVLAVDKSGSMAGEKIELAKDAARGAVELLGTNDSVGVLAFEGDTYWVADIHPCTDKTYVLERISRLSAGGGTNLYPALNEAFLALEAANSKLKHCIVLSDGNSTPGDFDTLVAAMAAAQITVSTVAVGLEADRELLQRIAETGRGRYYFCEDASSVPQVFARETIVASRSALHEDPFLPQVLRSTPVLADLDLETAPFLLGFVGTRPKATSEVILGTESDEPLLAWWRFGLGTTVAFTSDASSRWAAEWLDWPGFSRFWAQVARHAMRPAESRNAKLAIHRENNTTHISLDVVDDNGEFINGALTEVDLIATGGNISTHEIAQTGPGRYEATLDTSAEQTAHFQVRQSLHGKTRYRASRAVAASYPEELRFQQPNVDLLRQLAEATGGRFDPSPEEVFLPLGTSGRKVTRLWPLLVIAASLLSVLDVALRRIDMARFKTHE